MKTFHKYKPHYSDNLKLAIPVVISQLGHTLVQTSDIIIVGHFAGTVALAAVSLGSSLFSVLLLIGIGISYGSTPLIAQSNGRDDHQECGQLLSNSLFINVITGVLLFAIVSAGAIYWLDYLHQAPEVAR
jgi:MATE family multidrug resistance protein